MAASKLAWIALSAPTNCLIDSLGWAAIAASAAAVSALASSAAASAAAASASTPASASALRSASHEREPRARHRAIACRLDERVPSAWLAHLEREIVEGVLRVPLRLGALAHRTLESRQAECVGADAARQRRAHRLYGARAARLGRVAAAREEQVGDRDDIGAHTARRREPLQPEGLVGTPCGRTRADGSVNGGRVHVARLGAVLLVERHRSLEDGHGVLEPRRCAAREHVQQRVGAR